MPTTSGSLRMGNCAMKVRSTKGRSGRDLYGYCKDTQEGSINAVFKSRTSDIETFHVQPSVGDRTIMCGRICIFSGRIYRDPVYGAVLVVFVPASGTIAILCVLSVQKEERAGKYYGVFSPRFNWGGMRWREHCLQQKNCLSPVWCLQCFLSIPHVLSPQLVVFSVGKC